MFGEGLRLCSSLILFVRSVVVADPFVQSLFCFFQFNHPFAMFL